MNIAMGDMATWSLSIGALAGTAAAIWMAVMQSKFASKPVVDGHAVHLGKIDERLNSLEKAQEDQPDIHELAQRIERMGGDMKGLSAEMKGLSETINRIERPLNMLLEHELRGNR